MSCVPWLIQLNAAISSTRYTKRRSTLPSKNTRRIEVSALRIVSGVFSQTSDSFTRERMISVMSAGRMLSANIQRQFSPRTECTRRNASAASR